jgi:hypothetical protein
MPRSHPERGLPQENRPQGTPRPHGARPPRIEPAPPFNREAHQQDHQFLDKGKEMVFTSRTVLTTNVQIKRRLTRGTIKKAFFTLEAGPSTGAGIDLDILINGASAINDHPHIGVGQSQSTEARLNVPVYDGDEMRLQLTGTLSDATGPFVAHVWIDGN